MIQSLHVHSTFDDGANTPEEMVRAALDSDLRSVGISAHSPIEGEDWCLQKSRVGEFKAELRRLQKACAPRIEVWCGLEYDACSEPEFEGFDYVIGSVHELRGNGRRYAFDNTLEEARALVRDLFSGDADAAAREYFAAVARCASMDAVDIVGHFDLLTKFNERERIYDTTSPAYRAAALAAMEKLARAGKIFEINTGAISRGYRTSPYPEAYLLRALREMDGRVTVTSDSHSARTIDFGCDTALTLARECGFEELWLFNGEGFAPERL